MLHITISYCSIDRLFYIYSNEVTIHTQQKKPTQKDIDAAVISDQWNARFKDMRHGVETRVSQRIFDDMLGSVPPLNVKTKPRLSFYNGEPFSDEYYHFFERRDDFIYGSIRNIHTGELFTPMRSKAEVN